MTSSQEVVLVKSHFPLLKKRAKELIETIHRALPVENESWASERDFVRNPQKVWRKVSRVCRSVENVLARLRPLIPSGPKNEIPTDTLPHAVNEVDLSFKLILGIFGWHIRLPSPNELIELPQPNPISPGRLGLFSEAVLYMGKVLDQFAANPLLKKKIAALDEPETNERKKEHWEKPFWDSERGELRFKERRIKKYKQRAPNHRVILDAFQSQGWPPRIDNPFDHKKQLDETIQGMNRGIRKICFERDGTGEGVLWKLR